MTNQERWFPQSVGQIVAEDNNPEVVQTLRRNIIWRIIWNLDIKGEKMEIYGYIMW